MTRKRTLAGFDAVASTKHDNNIINDNNNKNKNDNANVIENILKNKKPPKKLTGLYLEDDVARKLDEVAGGTKGAKSEIVNTVLRRFFQEQGLM